MTPREKKSVLIFHLDLGVGGAERLIVCLALALLELGWEVTIATTRFSEDHCFPELLNFKGKILTYGSFIPRSIFGTFTALFSIFRLLYLYICLLLFREKRDKDSSSRSYDLVINDQLGLFNPHLKSLGRKIAFYCHYPDPLMASQQSAIKRWYR